MSRADKILWGMRGREESARLCMSLPDGTRVQFKAPRRTLLQNDKMWAMLTDVSHQLDWQGQKYVPDDWKDYFMHALRRGRWMPDEEGGMVPIGMRTSDLSKDEMSDLIEIMYEFGNRHNVEWGHEADNQHRSGEGKG